MKVRKILLIIEILFSIAICYFIFNKNFTISILLIKNYNFVLGLTLTFNQISKAILNRNYI